MLLRIRSNVGVWRVDGLDASTATIQTVLDEIGKTRPHVVYEKPLSSDPAGNTPLNTTQTLQSLQLQHGSMIYCRVDPSTCVDITTKNDANSAADNNNSSMTDDNNNNNKDGESSSKQQQQQQQQQQQHMRRIIGPDGTIKLVPTNEAPAPGQEKGFRKGMMALRDIKMHWTLTDFVAMDSQYEFKIQRQKEAVCKQVSFDKDCIANFQIYLQRFNFQRKRFGFLYGTFVNEDGEVVANESSETNNNNNNSTDEPKKAGATKVRVEAIYEPPQEVDNEAAEGFIPAEEDPLEEKVEQIASLLGWRKVGWILGHEAREKGFVMSAAEVIMAAEFQLEAADGVNETPFVTVLVAPNSEGHVTVEAFQVSQQCMAMVAEEALEVGPDPKFCNVNETFTAIQEGKPSPTVENNFFLTVVPIAQHTSQQFIAEFPRLNRDLDDRTPSHDELKHQLSKSGTAGWTFEQRLADFNLLIYLSQFLDIHADFPKICASLVDPSVPLDDGYKILIKSMAGMDGAY